MSSINKVTLLGYIGQEPKKETMRDGSPMVKFSVATTKTWKDKQTAEKKSKTEWHNIVIWNENLCNIAAQYLKKGSRVYLEGQLQTRKWQDQSGADRYSTEIVLTKFGGTLVLLGDATQSQSSTNPSAMTNEDRMDLQNPQTTPYRKPSNDILDDGIPF